MSTPGGNGPDTNSELGLNVSTNAPEAAAQLDAFGTVVVKLIDSVDKLAASLDKQAEKQEKAKKSTTQLTEAQREQQRQQAASLELQKQADKAAEQALAAGEKLIAQLQDEIATFGMSRLEVKAYRAEILGVSEAADPLIAKLEALTRAQFELTTQQRRDIETMREQQGAYVAQQRMVEDRDMWLHNQRAKDYADYISWWEKTLATEDANQAKMMEIGQSRDLWHHEQRAKDYADYISWWEKTLAAEEAASARMIAIEQARDVELNNMRNAQIAADAEAAAKRQAIVENRDMQMHNMRTKMAEDEMKLAERQAINDIRYAEMSTSAKIRELEKLTAYQAAHAAGSISAETMANNFSPAMIKDLPNLSNYRRELDAVRASLEGATHSTEGLQLTNKSFARELIVIGHEFVTGNWSRIPGSMMVLGERMNAAALLFSGMGLAALSAVVALGGFVYATAKAIEAQHEMNNAMILTNNYAGITEGRITGMAAAIANSGQNIAIATEAITALTASGKFTAEQIGTISEAIVNLERTTGYSIGNSVKNFESLQVKVGDSATAIRDKLLQSVLKLDEQFHYLDSTMINQILTYTRMGDMQKASSVATDQLTEATNRMAREGEAQLGYFAKRWLELKDAVQQTIHAMGEWGKTQTSAMKVGSLSAELAAMDASQNAALSRAALPGQSGGAAQIEAMRKNFAEQRAKKSAELTAAIEQNNKEVADAERRGQETRLQSQVNFYKISDERDRVAMERKVKGVTATEEKIEQYMTRVKAAKELEKLNGVVDPQYSDEAVAHQIDLIKQTSEKKAKAVSDGRKQTLLMNMADAAAEFKLLEDQTKAEEALIKSDMRTKEITTEEGYAKIRAGREQELVALDNTYAKQKKILDDYNAKDAKDAAEKERRQHALLAAYNLTKQKINEAIDKNDSDEDLAKYKEKEALLKSINKEGKAVTDSLQKQIDKERLHNEEIGKTKEQIELAKKAQQDAEVADLENQASAYSFAIQNLALNEAERELYTAKLQQIQSEIALRKDLANVQAAGAGIASDSPDVVGKLADETARKWKKAGEDIKKSLRDAFGDVGGAIGDMFKVYADGQANTIKINDEYNKKRAAALGTENMQQRLLAAEQEKANELTANQMHQWGGMADAASNYFDQSSTGYKTLHAVAQVFHAAEMALIIAKQVPLAINAVLGQGAGDPYTAFARMAAMAAVVTGLGVAISASQAGAMREDVAKKAQETQGTGTVLGDSTAKSNSIQKALDLIGDNSDVTLRYTSQMAQSLKNIESGIGGLANIIFRTSGMTSGQNFGVQTGILATNKGDPIANALGLGGVASTLANMTPFLGGIINKLQSLWGKTEQSIVDTGLEVKGSINDLMNGTGVQQYVNVEQKKTSWFGLVKDYSYNTVEQNAGSEIAQQFGTIFTNLNKTLTAAGAALGMGGQRLQEALATTQISVDPTSFKDLKGQELVDALNAVVSKASDQVAQAVLPGLDKFMQVGEGYAQTAIRVATGAEKAQVSLQKLGISAINYGDIVNKQGDVAAEIVRQSLVARETSSQFIISWSGMFNTIAYTTSGIGDIMSTLNGTADEMIATYKSLVEIRRIMMATNSNPNNNRTGGNLTQATVAGAGGVEDLASGTRDFLDKYFSDTEKTRIETQRLTEEFNRLGLQLPRSKEEFRSLLVGIDQTTEAGQALYGSMIVLSGSFADLMDSAKNASATTNTIIDDQIARVNDLSEKAQRWLAVRNSASDLQDSLTENMGGKVDTSARQEALWAMLAQGDKISPEQQISLATELQNLILKKYQTEKANATDLLNVAKSLRSYLDSLKVGDLAPGTSTEKLNEAKSQYQLTLSKAQGGDATAAGDLQNKAQAYLSLARDYYASSDPYKEIFASVYSSLDQYATTAESAEQLQAEGNAIAQGQIDELSKLRDIVSVVMEHADTNYEQTVTELQASLNALQMINTSLNVLSTVPDLLRGMPAELAANLQQSLGGIINAVGSANDQAAIQAAAVAAQQQRVLDAAAQAAQAAAASAASAQAAAANATNAYGGAQVPQGPTPFYQLYFQHANGLNFVPYDGYQAELHRGERVLTAAENEKYTFDKVYRAPDDEKVLTSTANRSSIGAGQNTASSGALAQEIKALREELAALREDQAKQHQESIATNYDANDRAANKVASATCDAADKANWQKRSAATLR